MNVCVFETSDEAPDGKNMVAFIYLNNIRLDIVFSGNSRDELIEKAVKFYETERPKAKAVLGSESEINISSQKSEKTTAASTHGLSGSKWIINRATKHRLRIPSEKLAEYLSQGYVAGKI